MKNLKSKAVYFTIIAFLALAVIIYFGVKYLTDQHVFDKPKAKEEAIDPSIMVGTFMDDYVVTDANKNVTQSTIVFDDKKKFVLTVDTCSKTVQLDGTYEVKNNTDINLTFNTNNANYNEYVDQSNHKNDKLVLDASGILTYVGDGWGCSPLKGAKYILKIDVAKE